MAELVSAATSAKSRFELLVSSSDLADTSENSSCLTVLRSAFQSNVATASHADSVLREVAVLRERLATAEGTISGLRVQVQQLEGVCAEQASTLSSVAQEHDSLSSETSSLSHHSSGIEPQRIAALSAHLGSPLCPVCTANTRECLLLPSRHWVCNDCGRRLISSTGRRHPGQIGAAVELSSHTLTPGKGVTLRLGERGERDYPRDPFTRGALMAIVPSALEMLPVVASIGTEGVTVTPNKGETPQADDIFVNVEKDTEGEGEREREDDKADTQGPMSVGDLVDSPGTRRARQARWVEAQAERDRAKERERAQRAKARGTRGTRQRPQTALPERRRERDRQERERLARAAPDRAKGPLFAKYAAENVRNGRERERLRDKARGGGLDLFAVGQARRVAHKGGDGAAGKAEGEREVGKGNVRWVHGMGAVGGAWGKKPRANTKGKAKNKAPSPNPRPRPRAYW
ncbi:hypothetical protein KIPB_003781 [Kipferlia bialata]|uniref:Uncharacterized protein n=1 Tax=Kipferlia bialata TaxID=797122 RepID=A0A9K3CUZ7_9EUKA|nr:hypothetical protein KIPB_003781 [Kipferlia bialata]|eukprot:g3781.t1